VVSGARRPTAPDSSSSALPPSSSARVCRTTSSSDMIAMATITDSPSSFAIIAPIV
jgi:hypothetical protein